MGAQCKNVELAMTNNSTLVVYFKDQHSGPDIQVELDHVLIVGHRVPRPDRIPRSVWMAYWEDAGKWIEKKG